MKLNEQQIHFIDDYLEFSGVKYLDIRYEMTDHVATALEQMDGDFEESFRNYMLLHKKDLLDSNNKFRSIARRNATKMIIGNLIKLRFLTVAAVIFIITSMFTRWYPMAEVTESLHIGFVIVLLSVMLYYRYMCWKRNDRFSVIDNVMGFSTLVVYCCVLVVKPETWLVSENGLLVYYACFSAFIIEMIFTFRELIKKYRLQYGR